MKRKAPLRKWAALLGTTGALALFGTQQASATGFGQLGILDTSGINPATGVEWAIGDAYHLIYITDVITDPSSTEITDYNTWVQDDANTKGYGAVTWNVLGSTATVDAIDNAPIAGSVVNVFDSASVATDSADFWDLNWGSSNNITDNAGGNKNVWTGTLAGGTAQAGNELGATDESVRLGWSGWNNWDGTWRADDYTVAGNDYNYAAISEQLTVVPEASATLLIGLAGLALLRRRR
jgi:hypothetical protein